MLSSLIGRLTGELPGSFGYFIGEEFKGSGNAYDQKVLNFSYYSIYKGCKKSDSSPATVFIFNKKHASENEGKFAKTHFQRLRTLRFPSILRVLDAYEGSASIYIVTEPCTPLIFTEIGEDIAYGIFQITSALNFINEDCRLAHGLINPLSIFVTHEGNWRLGSFDCCTGENLLSGLQQNIREHSNYTAAGWYPSPSASTSSPLILDRWGLYGLVCWLHASMSKGESVVAVRSCPKTSSGDIEFDPETLSKFVEDKNFLAELRKLAISVDHKMTTFLNCRYFTESTPVKVMRHLEDFAVKTEKAEILEQVALSLDTLPPDFACKQVVPVLINAVALGGGGPAGIEALSKISRNLTAADFSAKIAPTLLNLYSSNERVVRYALLQHLHYYGCVLEIGVGEAIFERIHIGLNDSVAELRGATLEALFHLYPRVGIRTRDLILKCLSRGGMDHEPVIRLTSTLCFAKIIPLLENDLAGEISPSFLAHAAKDSHLQNRLAVVEAIYSSWHCFLQTDLCVKILPILCALLLDSETQPHTIRVFTHILAQIPQRTNVPLPPPQNTPNKWGGTLGILAEYAKKYTTDEKIHENQTNNSAQITNNHTEQHSAENISQQKIGRKNQKIDPKNKKIDQTNEQIAQKIGETIGENLVFENNENMMQKAIFEDPFEHEFEFLLNSLSNQKKPTVQNPTRILPLKNNAQQNNTSQINIQRENNTSKMNTSLENFTNFGLLKQNSTHGRDPSAKIPTAKPKADDFFAQFDM